jgi:DUF1365 family protein
MKRRSRIFRGKVVHERLGDTPHAFTYPATFFGFDLSELDQLSKAASLFGHNQRSPLNVRDRDYLYGKDQSIARQLDELLPPEAPDEHTLLISSPRYLGYAFNPVNFHLRMSGSALNCVVAEVNNTFGDRHVYPLLELEKIAVTTWTARCPKDFHVSPFNDMKGEYHFTFRITEGDIYLGVDLHRDGVCVLKTWIQGTAQSLTNRSIWRYALLHPFDTALNSMPRIIWQAALLYYKKKLQVHTRPKPKSANTVVDRDDTENQQLVI